MSQYRRGVRYENKIKDILEREGFYVVRSAGSRGVVDLVAIGFGRVLLIQCKTNSKISQLEIETLKLLQRYGDFVVPCYTKRTPKTTFLVTIPEMKPFLKITNDGIVWV